MKLSRCPRKISWKIWIQLRDRPTQGRTESFSALASAWPDKDRTKLRYEIAAEKRHVESRVVVLLIERPLHQSVRNDSDDGAPRCRLSRIKNTNLVANRALIPPILSSEARVDHRD